MQIKKLTAKDNYCGYGHPMEVPHAPEDKTKIVDNSDITRKGYELQVGSREYTGWSVTCPMCHEMWQKKGVEGQMLDLYGVWFFWESFGPIKVRRTITIKRSKIKELSYERLIRVVHPVIHGINGSVEERIGTSYSEEGDSIPGPWAIFAARGRVRNEVATGMGIARMSVKAVMKSQTRKEVNEKATIP